MTPKQEAFARAYVETGNASEASEIAGVDLLPVRPLDGKSYVYLLLCPDMETVIYVGKGKGQRMHHHVRDAKAGRVSGTKKHNAIVAHLEKGQAPVAVAFETGLSDRAAYLLEKSLIAAIGTERLANTAAGRGCPHERVIARARHCLACLVKVPPPGKEAIHADIVLWLNKAIAVCEHQIALEQRG